MAAGPFRLVEVTARAGIDARHELGAFMDDGAGVAVGDLDGDGDADIVFSQGLVRPLAVYRNEGGLRFTPTPRESVPAEGGSAVALGDLDRDGDLDLVVACLGRVDLLENVGGLRFRSHAGAAPLEMGSSTGGSRVGTSALVADLDLDGRLDVAVTTRRGPEVFRNEGDWTFRDVSESWGVPRTEHGLARALAYADLTADGLPDLFVAVDTDQVSYDAADLPQQPRGDLLLVTRRDPDGRVRLVDETDARGVGGARSSMGVLVSDFDADGQADLLISNIGAKALLLGRGAAPFVASTTHRELASPYLGSGGCAAPGRDPTCLVFSWGLALGDGDGDGDEDLFVAHGALSTAERLGVFERLEGSRWREHPHGGRRTHGLALVAADLDDDGDLDLLQTNLGGPAALFENTPRRPVRSVQVTLRGRRSNPHGVGALVTSFAPDGRRTAWTVGVGGCPYGSPPHALSVPLGAHAALDLVVRWPGGSEQTVRGVTAGRRVEIIEEG